MGDPSAASLVIRVGERRCALPIEIVRETMRALPIDALAGAPHFVRGAALIRGALTPVIDLGSLLDGTPSGLGRLVTLRAERAFAIAVDEVHGVEQVAAGEQMLAALSPPAMTALAALDPALPSLLGRGTTLPERAPA